MLKKSTDSIEMYYIQCLRIFSVLRLTRTIVKTMFIRQIITQLKEKDMYFKLSKYPIHRTHEWNNTHTKPKGNPYRIVVCWFQRTLKQLEREQTDTQTHTHTQDNYSNPRVYSNPRGCVPRVNEHKHKHPHTVTVYRPGIRCRGPS